MSLEKNVASLLPQPAESFSLVKLAGEASYREYFRVTLSSQQTYILMKMPAGISSASEEIMKTQKIFHELPFINVQKYLASLNLPVPQIMAYSAELGLLLLQDLGDYSFEKAVRTANPAQRRFFYEQAIDLLIKLQTLTSKPPTSDCMAFFRQFDEELLLWEFNHFIEYGIEDRLRLVMAPVDKIKLELIGKNIVGRLVATPQGFVHRDFQSRNIIVYGYELWLIDFQDALLGPLIYDLTALLRDSYIQLDQADLHHLIRFYVDQVPDTHPYARKFDQALGDFHLMTLQRKLKDTGRFQYIATVKKNPTFLPNVGPSLDYVKQALGALVGYEAIHEILAKYLPEFKD